MTPHPLPCRCATLLPAVLLATLAPLQTASADTRASFRVSASVTRGCLVNHAVPGNGSNLGDLGRLDFGRHPPASTAGISTRLSPNSAVTLSCTPGVTLRMTVNGGLHLAGGLRHLRAGEAQLAYRLYLDAGLSQEIPVNASVHVDYDDAENIRLPINAALRLPGNQASGRYQDRLGVTLSW
ncbi:Csu type fimbrial protein [Pseudomonas citronellolis]|uniref:Csu type fimbrial protein n=1 Tax=Pseudomonas citronellolis TaxID=53408 RepID=UPI00209CC6E1|nr:spore coat protein U domain-containing protein [Pseudomonas citronellolis]MCP1603689.1 spore coat protein U-like protein [Pseudomonas citronellolis]MCP1653244.1 spore coat protein U-like protein [Pseudomonas citronellolis]MCP1720436.1 spore coat protein U-like protein [Pseudomonas citronellolis]